MSGRLFLKRLPNLTLTVKHFQTSCAKYSAAAASNELKRQTSSYLTDGACGNQTTTVSDTSKVPPSCLDKRVNLPCFIDVTGKEELDSSDAISESSHDTETVELVAMAVDPKLLKDVAPLFPDRTLSEDSLSSVSICLRTKQDMSVWNPEVQKEREELCKDYTQSSVAICETLRANGFWADFIDTSCGKPYLSKAHTNATLFETSYVMSRLAGSRVSVLDLGCCQVMEHALWGTFVYVGVLFTDAPRDHPVLSAIRS